MKQTRTILLIAVMFLARIAMAQESAFGYGANATGGGNATPIIVTNVTELNNALKADGNKVILVSGTITFTDHLSVQATDKTLMGLPGSKLVSNEQNKDNSGILYFKSGSNNLILRNLTFEGPGAYDCDGWDLLCFDGVTDAWVDHCDFSDGCDGNFDNKGNSDNITVSWCRFHYLKPPRTGGSGGTDDHRFTNLIGSDSSDKPSDGRYSMTWAYCWWDEGCRERMTRARNSELHFLNCYWNSSVANYYIGPENVNAYVEGCSFIGLDAEKIWKEYGGTNNCKWIDCYADGDGLPSNSGSVSAPSYDYTAMSAEESRTAISDPICGAGATLIVSEDGSVSSACNATEPLLTSEGEINQEVYTGQAISTISFTAGGTATSISVSNLPAGLTSNVDNLTLTISGIPTENGTYTVTASDGTQTTSLSGSITLNEPSAAPANEVCIDFTKGDVPSIANGGIPSGWEGLEITVNNTKSTWTENGFNMGGNADYIVIDFRNFVDATIEQVSFDVTIPNLDASTGKNTIGYRFTEEGTNDTYTISSSATETVTLSAPEQSELVWIQRTASTGTTIGQICIMLKESSTEATEPSLTSTGSLSQNIAAGQAISTVSFTAGGTATDISVSNLPAGLSYDIDNLTLTISGVPTESGTYTVTASDDTQSTSISGSITLIESDITIPAYEVCIDLKKGDVPSIANGGIPTGWEDLVITVNNTKSDWTDNGFKMGGDADYIVIDFRNYEETYIDEVSFDVTIPNLETAKRKTIGYRFTEDGDNNTYTISSPATELVTLTAPAQSGLVWIQRTAGTGTTIGQICITLTQNTTTTGIIDNTTESALRLMGTILVNESGKTVQIFNMQGQLVASGEGNIDISNYANGIYVARSIDGSSSLKFMK